MPGGIADLDAGFPAAGGTAERQVAALRDYLTLLLENLRYILRNLSPENFNESEVLPWLADKVEAKTVVSNTVITNELYADYGAVADLTVDELRTDYQKAQRYLAGDEAPMDWLDIHDEEIDFLSGTVHRDGGVPATEQLNHRGRYFWWTDASMTQMTSLEPTAWPVTVYRYDTLTKGSIRFQTVTKNGVSVKIPTLILGAGVGDPSDPDAGRGFLRKDTDSLALWLHGDGDRGVFIGQYTDIVGLRKTTRLDFSGWDGGSFSETLDGGAAVSYGVTFSGGVPVKITDGDGHETAVVW